ncbi:D-methionine transport system permease protein [Clostridium beijerinckii]|nr:D-methionine transport system permease protein [Clostridium beijerinckii]
MNQVIVKALIETLEMVFASTIGSLILGFIPAIILTVTAKDGLKPNKIVYTVLDLIINILRSFPVIILMVAIIPLTRFIAGKSIGTEAAIVPLTIAAAPFVARIIESSLREVDKGIIEAARSFGASNTQIIFKVMLKEAIPSIASGITLTIISIVGYSAMAGTIGVEDLVK